MRLVGFYQKNVLGLHEIFKLCLTRKKGNLFFFYCIHKNVGFYGA